MKKILIVDDETGIVEEIKDFLAEEGFEVHTADTGKTGIELLTQLKPHLVLLDMKLPDMPGLEVLRVSKRLYPHIRVIVTTGYVDQKVIDETQQLERDAFLQKPFDLDQLKEEMDRLIGSA